MCRVYDIPKISQKAFVHLKSGSFIFSGNFRCPVTFRTFTPTSHIVAICQTGNVYSLEAIEELNLKPGHLRDLLTDEPFQRKDIITLQVWQLRFILCFYNSVSYPPLVNF